MPVLFSSHIFGVSRRIRRPTATGGRLHGPKGGGGQPPRWTQPRCVPSSAGGPGPRRVRPHRTDGARRISPVADDAAVARPRDALLPTPNNSQLKRPSLAGPRRRKYWRRRPAALPIDELIIRSSVVGFYYGHRSYPVDKRHRSRSGQRLGSAPAPNEASSS